MDESSSVNLGELRRIATRRFGNLSEAEAKLLEAASEGKVAYCGPSSNYGDPANDPAKADVWGSDRSVRSELFRWLSVKSEATSYVDARGLNVFGAKVIGKLDLSHLNIPFPVHFERCRLMDEAELTSVRIPELGFSECRTQGLLLENAEIKGNLIIKETVVEGGVRLLAAQIGSTLNCRGSTLRNPVRNCRPDVDFPNCGRAFDGDRMRVSGGVFLRNGFIAYGEVALNGATIGGDLSFRGSTLNNLQGEALAAENVTVDGNVFFYGGFAAFGAINLSDAKIGGNVNCLGGIFDTVVLQRAVIRNSFVWSQLPKADVAQLDLGDAVIGSLADDEKSWPKRGNLHLDGFSYKRLTSTPLDTFGEEQPEEAHKLAEKRLGAQFRIDTPTDVATRLRWLDLDTEFKPQPYRQLADVLSEMGDEEGAKHVRFEMERRMRAAQRAQFPALERPIVLVGDKTVELTIGYGVYPLHALWWTAGLCLAGWVIHRRANMLGVMAPAKKEVYEAFHETGKVPQGYPPFSPFVYSLENCIPFLKLGQDAQWEADPSPIRKPVHSARNVLLDNPPLKWIIDIVDFVGRRPAWLRRLRWAMIITGWLLATFFVAGLTGLVKTH